MELKDKYFTPDIKVMELNTNTCILEASGLGTDSDHGNKDAESRLDGGSWGDGGWY